MEWEKLEEDEKTILELKKIYAYARQTPEQFLKGYLFAKKCALGMARTIAYQEAYDATPEEAKSNATNKFRAKWIQQLINLAHIPEDNRYRDIQITMIQRLKEIIETSNDNKLVLDSIRQLHKMIDHNSKEEEKEEIENTTEETELSHFEQILKKIKETASQGKTLSSEGALDVKILK